MLWTRTRTGGYVRRRLSLEVNFCEKYNIDYPMSLILLSTWSTWVGRGGHTETLRYLATPTSKIYGWLITFFLIM